LVERLRSLEAGYEEMAADSEGHERSRWKARAAAIRDVAVDAGLTWWTASPLPEDGATVLAEPVDGSEEEHCEACDGEAVPPEAIAAHEDSGCRYYGHDILDEGGGKCTDCGKVLPACPVCLGYHGRKPPGGTPSPGGPTRDESRLPCECGGKGWCGPCQAREVEARELASRGGPST
jgi:hypothetical protein